MLKNIALLLLCFTSTLFSFSLKDSTLTLRAGYNLSTSDLSHVGSINRLHLGMGLLKPIQPNTTLGIEGLYSLQGFKRDGITTKLDYIKVPLYAMVSFPYNYSSFTPHVLGGAYVSYLLNAEADLKDVNDSVYDGDYGFLLGVGLSRNCPLRPHSIIRMQMRYEVGLKEVSEGAKNNVLSFSFGYDI